MGNLDYSKLEKSIGELNQQFSKQWEELNTLMQILKKQEVTYRRFLEERGLSKAYEKFAETEALKGDFLEEREAASVQEMDSHTKENIAERRLPGNVLK